MPETDRGLLLALDAVRTRWRIVALACAISVTLTLAVSLLLPKKYTAVTRIVIEPPAGSDPRASTAVSPIYLESLHSYESFASSDDLFLKAVEKFGLRNNQEPIDKLKKSVLEADMPRNTKILEIRATLPDPKIAHQLALYMSEETVKLNQAVSRDEDLELGGEAERQSAEAQEKLRSVEQEWAEASIKAPAAQLKVELESDEELRSVMQREMMESEVISEPERAEVYRRRLAVLERSIAAKQKLFAERSSRIEQLSSARASALAAAKAADVRLQDTRSAKGSRGERLRLLDPGIVPERPSFPNIPLNAVIALFATLVLSMLYLTLELSYASQMAQSKRRSLRVAGRND
jgi:capsular polysaccharide biosynthesis protein